MMKKVLSVALSVIMLLGVISVPSFAADPAATEYTVSAVTYQRKYIAYNDDGESEPTAVPMYEPATEVPANGEGLVPSVEISASAETTATVIFAVYTDGVLTNAFYDTKAVGAVPVTFTKEITVADREKETYKVYALGADGKAIAPASSFPEADNALEYMVITYADGTSDKIFGEDLEGDTIVAAVSEARKVANPSIKVVPADNTTVVTVDMDADFWSNGATVELKALDGTVATYNVVSDLVKAGFTPVLGKIYQYEGATLTKTIKTYGKQYTSFEAAQEVVNVTVPYGTASVTMDPIIIYENGVQMKSTTEEISMDGNPVKEYTIGVGSKEYKFVFAWDDSAPYIYGVNFGGGYSTRSAVLRADGTSAIGYTMSTDISKEHTTATVANGLTSFTVNGTDIPLNDNFTILAIAREDNFARTDMIQFTSNNWAHMTENEAWTSFNVSEPATVYVKMSHANAAEADFVWKEGAEAGWTKATSSSQGTIYYKTFAAGETVNVPSQVVTAEELAFVNAKLEAAYPASGAVQFKYAMATNGAVLNYSTDGKAYNDGTKTWEAHPTGKNSASDEPKFALEGVYHRGLYYRNTAEHKLSIGAYGSTLFIAVAFDNVPGEGGDPVVPPVDPDEPGTDDPVAPMLTWESAIALTGTPKTQSQGPANRRDLHAKGLYNVGAKSGSVELPKSGTEIDLVVPYGVEVVKFNGGVSVNLLSDADHAATATVTVEGVEYTVNVSWAAYAYDAQNTDMPLLYDLEYFVEGKTGLHAADWYYAIPTNLVLDADHDLVLGQGTLLGTKADGSDRETITLTRNEGEWLTAQSHNNVNLTSTNNGNQVNRLHLAPTAFESWVENGDLEDKYALNGATVLVAHYEDSVANNAVRYKFKTAVDGYVIVASNKANTALTEADGWTRLEGNTMKFTNTSTTAQGQQLAKPPIIDGVAHVNVATSFAEWSGACDYIYIKKVDANEVVEIAESTVTSGYPPVVIVATEDMLTVELSDDGEDDDDEPTDPTPTGAKLASLTYSTAAHLRHTEAAVETNATQAWAEDATEYVVTVPIGTGVVTVSAAADYAATPNTLAQAVEVDLAGADEKTAEILGCTVKFVWDNTDPYITDVVVNAAFKGRWGVDYGADGDLSYQTTGTNDSGELNTTNREIASLAGEGETAPTVTKYVYSIATHTMNGQPHLATTTFGMRDTAYEGTTAANSLLSFKVSAPATVYVKAVALDHQWEELVEAGWTEAGTLNGNKLYKKDFAAGDYVYLPGTPVDDEEAAALNASEDTVRYIKYDPTETVETTTGSKTQSEAFTGMKTLKEGYYFKWSYDADAGKLEAPVKHATDGQSALTIERPMNKTGYDPVFYVQFAEPAAAPTLASYTVSTTVAGIQKDVAAVTDEAGTFADTANYEIVVPAGTATATATITDTNDATGTASVEFGTKDVVSTTVNVGGADYTVKFVWDDTNPYFYNVTMKQYDDRLNIQYGDKAETLKVGGKATHTPDGAAVSEYAFVGVPTPDATADTIVLGIPNAIGGQPHMLKSQFNMLKDAYPATGESNAFLTFQVGGEGTIYVKSPANGHVWPEMEDLVADDTYGWYRVTYEDGDVTKNASIGGYEVYAIDVEKGDTVMIPGLQITDDYIADYNANLAAREAGIRYIKYANASTVVVTTTGEKTWAAGMTEAGITSTNRMTEGTWFQWTWDEEEDLPILPKKYNDSNPYGCMATNTQMIVYGYFGEYESEPSTPGTGGGTGGGSTPGTPGEPTGPAVLASLSYTTDLVVGDSPKESAAANAINGSIHTNGIYNPTLVTEAAAVAFTEGETEIDVTVPYGTEVVTLAGKDSADADVEFDAINLINNNGAATVTKTVGETEYTINVAWAAADDALAGLTAGNMIYDLKYRVKDLANTNYYNLVPTKLVLTEQRIDTGAENLYLLSTDAAAEAAGETPANAPAYPAGSYYVTTYADTHANLTVHNAGAVVNRGKLTTIAFDPWVRAGLVTASGIPGAALPETTSDADVDAIAYEAMNGATILVAHYQDGATAGAAAGVNASMTERMRFKVAQDSIVYLVIADDIEPGEGWTKFEGAGKLNLHNQVNKKSANNDLLYAPTNPTKYIGNLVVDGYNAGTYVYYTYAAADETVVLNDENFADSNMPGLVFIREIDEIPVVTPPVDGDDENGDEPAPTSLGDIEDVGVLADTDNELDVTQDAGSADVTIEGNLGEEARGEHVIAFVLADGKTLADVQAAIAAGDGDSDLVAEGLILAMGSATVDANGDYSIDLTLPSSATSGSYDVVIGDETNEDALEFIAISEKVAAYNAIVNGEADPFANVGLIIAANDIYTGLDVDGQAAVESSVLAKDAVAELPAITEPTPGEYVGLENIAILGAIIDTRIAVEALNDGADAAELALVWDYILPAADAESDDIVAIAAAIYTDATALNATGKANVVDAITEQDYETKTVEGVQVSVKAQVRDDFAEAVFVELINNTAYTNINNVATFVNEYVAADVFEDLESVSTTTLATILRDHTVDSYADFEELVGTLTGSSDTPTTGGTEVIPSTPTTGGTTTGSMTNTTTGVKDPVTDEKPYKALSEFTDAGDAAWAAPALQLMLDRNILNGYEDDTIRPNNSATRQEVAKMLVQGLSEVNSKATTSFADVPAGEWYYTYVATAAQEGIIMGIGNNLFGTGALITREDLATLMYRYLVNEGIALDTTKNRVFTDDAYISDYAVDAVYALTNAGIINGYMDGSVNPKGNATRAEIAQVLANVIVVYGL